MGTLRSILINVYNALKNHHFSDSSTSTSLVVRILSNHFDPFNPFEDEDTFEVPIAFFVEQGNSARKWSPMSFCDPGAIFGNLPSAQRIFRGDLASKAGDPNFAQILS